MRHSIGNNCARPFIGYESCCGAEEIRPGVTDNEIKIGNIMKKLATAVFAFVFVSFLHIVSASATNFRSYVSSSGNDSDTCTASSPCATFHGAYDKTSTGGEIVCLNSGDFSFLTITKSITVNCIAANPGNAAPNNAGIGEIVVTTAATDRVILRGLDLDLYGALTTGLVVFQGSGTLVIDRVKVTSNTNGAGSGGIVFMPNGPGKLVVTDSIVANNGNPNGSGAGILVQPQSGGTAQVTLERVNVSGNVFGIAADGSSSTGGINMTVKDSVLASNVSDGLVATTSSGGAPIGVLVSNTASTNNGFGIRSIGPNVTVRVDGSKIAGNGTGVSALNGGALLSAGNNIVEANGSNGSFSGPLAFK
jgi:hypothetical protein